MTQEQISKNVREALAKVLDDFVNYYKQDKKKAAWATVDYDLEAGRIMLVAWPNEKSIEVCWSPASAGFGDLGTVIGSVSTEYFGIESAIFLLTAIIDQFMEE